MSMRPIDMLVQDAAKAASEGIEQIVITEEELRQLKDYELVIGTDNPDVAVFDPVAYPMVASIKLFVRRP